MKTITLDVTSSDTIELVKAQIQAKEGVRRHEQRLHFGETTDLLDKQTLAYYNIEDGDLLDLVIRGTGGAKRTFEGAVPRDLRLAQLHGGIELLLDVVSNEVRDEIRRINTDLRTFAFIDGIPLPALASIVQKFESMNRGITDVKAVKVLAPHMTPLLAILDAREAIIVKEKEALSQQCLLTMTRILLPEGVDNFDWQAFKVFLRDRHAFLSGVAFAAAPVMRVP
jgi:large subunit ribosomal protein L40e